jgi:hypothetical protein
VKAADKLREPEGVRKSTNEVSLRKCYRIAGESRRKTNYSTTKPGYAKRKVRTLTACKEGERRKYGTKVTL